MWDVKSVLRCSDNIVFSIGDSTNNGIISKMLKVDSMIRVYFKGKKAYNINLNTLKHVKLDYEILESVRRTVVSSEGTSPEKTVILSIKRLSDGEVFRIGDKIEFDCTIVKEITEISLDENPEDRPYKRVTPYLVCGSNYGIALNIAKKAKKPLFTTEDGVDIYEGDRGTYWIVKKNYSLNEWNIPNNYSPNSNVLKRFSTKEKAQEYIDNNKPLYSKQQIIDTIELYIKHELEV